MGKKFMMPREFFHYDDEWEFVGVRGSLYVFEHPETAMQYMLTRARALEIFGWVPGEY